MTVEQIALAERAVACVENEVALHRIRLTCEAKS